VDEVGAEAFLEEAPLLDDIERSFSKSKSRTQPGAEKPSADKPDKSAPSKQADADPRPVLKRKRWGKREESAEAVVEEKPPEKKAVKPFIKQEMVTARTSQRFTIEISPKGQQILRWVAMGLPVLLVMAIAVYLFAGRPARRARPRVNEGMAAADPAALEAQAMALYNAALEYYRTGKVEETVATLQQVISLFPLTSAGTQARQALDRMSQGQAPFGGAASPPEPAAPAGQTTPPDASLPADIPKKKAFIGIRKPSDSDVPPTEGTNQPEPTNRATPKTPGTPPQGSTLVKTNATARVLPEGFVAVSEAGVDSSGWPIEIICLRDQSHMMLVPAGDFEMGSTNGEPNTRPAHRVRLKAFYVDRYEVTLIQYKHFLEQRRLKNNPYRDLSQASLAAVPSDHHPVVGMAWRDANAYAEWSGKTLPTEAQWEKAARGGDARTFPWGSGTPVWEKPRQPKQIDPVGSFSWDVSPYGCFDLASNAWEWCADWYDSNSYNSSPAEDPEGPKAALPPVSFRDPEKVIRGGSPKGDVTWRGFSGIQEEPLHVGFRCALEVERTAPRTPAGVVTEAPRSAQPPPAARIPPGGYKF
jgi:formylglycine-generating enzyme required for sulfatase activity